jgi:hypothetical protein
VGFPSNHANAVPLGKNAASNNATSNIRDVIRI